MKDILEILKELRPDVDFNKENKLIDNGILDSFDIITLVGELNSEYDVSIGAGDLVSDNFNSKDSIYNLVEKLKNIS